MNYVLTQEEHLWERITYDNYNRDLISKLTAKVFQIASDKGLSMNDIADNFPGGIDRQSVQRFKRLGLLSRINPSLCFIAGLAVSLQVNIVELFED